MGRADNRQGALGVRAIGKIVERVHVAGRTIITISHDIDFCADHCSRLIVLGGGRVLLDVPRETVFAHTGILEQTAVEPPPIGSACPTAKAAPGLGAGAAAGCA